MSLCKNEPRLVDSTETIAEQVFCVQTIHFLKLFWQVTFWRIVT